MAQTNTFTLPDMISFCQTPKPVSPHYEQVAAEAKQWLSDGGHIEESIIDNLVSWKFALLVCTAFPGAGPTELRACTDALNMGFLLDDLAEDVDHHVMEAVSRSILGSMHDPESFNSTDMFGEMIRDVYKRMLLTASPGTHGAIMKAMESWLQSSVQQTLDRTGALPTVNDFIVSRRDNSGLKSLFSLIRYAYKLDVPDEVMAHPAIVAMEEAANDFKTWCNDILSYNIEQSKGQNINMVTVVMHQDNLDVQAAVDFVWAKCKDAHERFIENKKKLPSWDEKTDKDVTVYVDGLMDWMVGNVHWSYQSERYFGKSGSEVKETRVVKILPKRKMVAALASTLPMVTGASEVVMPGLESTQLPASFAQA